MPLSFKTEDAKISESRVKNKTNLGKWFCKTKF